MFSAIFCSSDHRKTRCPLAGCSARSHDTKSRRFFSSGKPLGQPVVLERPSRFPALFCCM